MRIRCCTLVGVASAALMVMTIDSVVQAADHPAAIAEIRRAANDYLAALNSGEPARITGCWTDDGTFVDADNVTHRAHALAKQEFQFQNEGGPPTQRRADEHHRTFRLITSDVALEHGIDARALDQTAASGASYLAVWVKRDGKWLLDYLKEFRISPVSAASPLEALQWMVGQWEAASDQIDAKLSVTWSDEGRYLIQKFTVQPPGQDELRGEQRIAWDASSQQIRSWLFRSDGGFAEGVWNLQGNTWVVKKSGVTPNGETTTSVNLWVNEGGGRCWFKSLNSGVGDRTAENQILEFSQSGSP